MIPDSGILSMSRKLSSILENRDWDGNQVNSLLAAMVPASKSASKHELDETLAELCRHIETLPAQEAGILALCSGTAVENGASPELLFQTLTKRLPQVLLSAKKLVDDVNEAFPQSEYDSSKNENTEGAFVVGSTAVPRTWIQEHVNADRDPVGAYNMLKEWCLPLISIATKHRIKLEELVAKKDLQDALLPLCPYQREVNFLFLLCSILLNEKLLFFHMPSRRAFSLTIDSVPGNFALHTLLASALCDALNFTGPATPVLECVRGTGPASCRIPSIGYWNLYTCNACGLFPDMDRSPKTDWIWNEGIPAHIPLFDNCRIVLAGENKIERSWNTKRTFEFLRPSVQLNFELSRQETEELLKRMTRSIY